MFYIIYKVTNQINGKFYIGAHKTNDLNDCYMGSGKYLRHAQEKYGLDNFTKEILFIYDNPGDMYTKEAEIVNADFLAEENTYNLKIGGHGGWDYVNDNGLSNLSPESIVRHKIGAAKGGSASAALQMKNKIGIHCEEYRRFKSEEQRQNASIASRSPESREKRKNTMMLNEHQQGDKNSQFGTCWISHVLVSSKKCKKEELPMYIDQGWYKGRNLFS